MRTFEVTNAICFANEYFANIHDMTEIVTFQNPTEIFVPV